MPLPRLKVDPPPVRDPAMGARPGEVPPRTLAFKVVLALPFFLGAAFVINTLGVGRPILVVIDIVLIALGFTIVLTRSFVVGAVAFVLGGSALVLGLYVAIMAGIFGGHQ